MTDLTRVGGVKPGFDYSVKDQQLQTKDRTGQNFLGRLWNSITRTPEQKEANRAAVREYVSQVGQRFGLEEARRVQGMLSGHLVKGNPLSGNRISIINSTLQGAPGSTAERLSCGLARAFNGSPTTDFARSMASPCKLSAWDTVAKELKSIARDIEGKPPGERAKAVEDLKNEVIAYMNSNGLDVDPVRFQARILDPLLNSVGLKQERARTDEDIPRKDNEVRQDKLDKAKPVRDLTTPQTERGERTEGGKDTPPSRGALRTAFGCSSAMVLAQAAKTESVMQTLLPDLDRRVGAFFGGLGNYLDGCKIDDSKPNKDMNVLKQLSGLMEKGFAPGSGGIGRFAPQNDWNPAWTSAKFNDKEPLSSEGNRKALDGLKGMVAFYERHAPEHMGGTVHEKELRGTQYNAIVGMVVVDILLGDGMDPGSCKRLEKELRVKDVMGDLPTDFKNSLRGNPLLMELKNDEVVKGLKGAVTGKLDSLMPPGLSDQEKQDLKKLVGESLGTSLTVQSEGVSGARGRFARTDPGFKDIAKAFSNRDAPLNNCMDLPDGTLDDQALENVVDLAGGDGSRGKVNELVGSIRNTDLLGHVERPITMQRQYTFPTRFSEGVNDPKALLQELKPGDKATPEEKALLEKFTNHVGRLDQGAFEELQETLQDVDVKDKQGRTHKVGDLVKDLSITNLIHKHEHRTLCSISGTTTDIALSLRAQMSEEQLREVLQPLVEYAKTGEGEIPDTARQLFTSISFFMQSGQYHTPAEVLGGLLIAGVGVQGEPPTIDPSDDKALRAGYENLLKGLGDTPEKFFAVREEDQESFRKGIDGVTGRLEKAQVDRIQSRLEPKQTSFEAPLSRIGIGEIERA